ncbi:hypothetical protein [Chamaesiphon sp. OTE_8_metabat_110]|nr:hypothetical protein [Chamaesiphon sp. OTE_8_metabat_110]
MAISPRATISIAPEARFTTIQVYLAADSICQKFAATIPLHPHNDRV